MYKVDVIIPTYKPDKSLFELIDDLEKQSIRPEHIIIMNTEEKYWNDFIDKAGANPADKYDNIRVGTNSRLDALQAAILMIYRAQAVRT